jgi:hypothetical protein
LDEAIRLALDPLRPWTSPSPQGHTPPTGLVHSFHSLGHLVSKGPKRQAAALLTARSECEEVGLDFSATRAGKRTGEKTAHGVLRSCEAVPQVTAGGGTPSEETPRLMAGVSRGRVSDLACNDLKSFLIDSTTDRCQKLGLPAPAVARPAVSDGRFHRPDESQKVQRPVGPAAGHPVVLGPRAGGVRPRGGTSRTPARTTTSGMGPRG